ncbi:pimelyl-ACP methyl ester esterase BioV [Sulfurimonas sp.]
MKFFSGFSLKNEAHFFDAYMYKSDFTVCGFSYGAIKAFEFTCKQIQKNKRVDTLQLFSPAFFQSKDEKFKRLQLLAYTKNENIYLQQFINACFLPYERKDVARSVTVKEELEELLDYQWKKEELLKLSKKGVKIEVYLGSEDKIVDVNKAKEFFLEVATVTYIKNANHFLLTK